MTRFAFAALTVALATSARAGVVLQYEDDQKKRTIVELEGKKLRSYSEGGGHDSDSAIFDGDRQAFYSLDDQKKTYRRLDAASGNEMAKSLEEAMETNKAKMTPEQRAQMEAFMAKRQKARTEKAPPNQHTWNFERAGGGQNLAGYTCDNYRVLRDGKLESEACFIPWSAGAFKKSDFEAIQEMGRFFEKTLAAMSEGSGRGSRRSWSNEWVTRFVETAPGFPAEMDRYDTNGKRTREMRLVKIEHRSLAASRFVPPTDYQEKKFARMQESDD